MKWKTEYIFLIIVLITSTSIVYGQVATTSDVLKSKIDERNNQIKQLEAEINQYNLEVTNAQGEAKTLQSTLKTLDLTKKKITTDINLTQTKISKTSLTIQELGSEIDDTKTKISLNKKAIASAMQSIQSLDDYTLVGILLSKKNISEIWNDIDNTKQIQENISDSSKQLALLQKGMETKQSDLTGQKKSLVNLQSDLTSKKQAVDSTVSEKATLLTQTKNKEQAFQALVQTKKQQQAQFEQEVADFEAQLNITIDQNSYPVPKHGILFWPLENIPTQSSCDTAHKVVSCIVRGFFRAITQNGVVVSAGHNGVDFRASTGTTVKNVLDGTVVGTGNTDIYKGCYGLGKWVMVNHDNGLSTIYMHLSVISVSVGQNLKTGDLIGLSGNTGNSEAPHLHVSVYATAGVRIQLFTNSIGCKQAVVPLADPKAYLDPLSYFPTI